MKKSLVQIIRDYTTEAGSLLFLLVCGITSFLIDVIVLAAIFTGACIASTIGLAIAYSRKDYLRGKK